jgi:hypothetical protein
MTTERKKALLLMGATLIIGILIGAIGTGLVGRELRRHPGERDKDHFRKTFTERIIKAVEADPAQAEKMKPIILETTQKIDALQKNTQEQVYALVDSSEVKMKSILSEEQMKKLKEFHRRGRERRQ